MYILHRNLTCIWLSLCYIKVQYSVTVTTKPLLSQFKPASILNYKRKLMKIQYKQIYSLHFKRSEHKTKLKLLIGY